MTVAPPRSAACLATCACSSSDEDDSSSMLLMGVGSLLVEADVLVSFGPLLSLTNTPAGFAPPRHEFARRKRRPGEEDMRERSTMPKGFILTTGTCLLAASSSSFSCCRIRRRCASAIGTTMQKMPNKMIIHTTEERLAPTLASPVPPDRSWPPVASDCPLTSLLPMTTPPSPLLRLFRMLFEMGRSKLTTGKDGCAGALGGSNATAS